MSEKVFDVQQILRFAEKQLKAGFKKFDIDASGNLSKNEFNQFMKRITGAFNVEQQTLTDIDDLIQAIDIDGDRISRNKSLICLLGTFRTSFEKKYKI